MNDEDQTPIEYWFSAVDVLALVQEEDARERAFQDDVRIG